MASRREVRRRLANRLRDYQLYSLERHRRLSRSGLRELARNVAICAGRERLFGEQIQFRYGDFVIPCDLAEMTGSGHAQWTAVIAEHLACYDRFLPLARDSRVLEVGCGLGRDAMALLARIDPPGSYTGLDIVQPSIEWCAQEITPRAPHFRFHHLDVHSEMYNPGGRGPATAVRFPVPDATVDRVVMHSVFTHMFAAAVTHYLREIARCLIPEGRALCSFFVVGSAEADAATGALTFRHPHPDAARVNDPDHPEAAVAFTEAQITAMAAAAGLEVVGVHPGRWCRPAFDTPNGQDLVCLRRAG